ncbi:putative replication protein [Klebsiella pneumoniae IS22]|nr:putative replication protein [Klebsiella pneumoniae IS22]
MRLCLAVRGQWFDHAQARQRVREALPELVALGWTVTEFAAGKYDITRPKAAG